MVMICKLSPWIWNVLIRTVEGWPSNGQFVIANGKIGFSPKPILKNAKPNLKLLSDFLKSDHPIPDNVRAWLADFCDPDSEGMHVTKVSPRGRDEFAYLKYYEAAKYADELMESGDAENPYKYKWDQAIQKSAKLHGWKERSLEDALIQCRKAREEEERFLLENSG